MDSRFVTLLVVAALSCPGVCRAQDAVFDAPGFQKQRDYFSQEPYENIDTLSGSLVLTFTDLVLPGNAGQKLRFQRTYNSKTHAWTFGVAGVPVSVSNPDGPPPEVLPGTPDYFGMPVLHGADGAEHRSTPLSPDVVMTDNFDRLTTAAGAYGSLAYAYDVHGNRQTFNGTSYRYEAGTLRLESQDARTFTDDNNGNLRTTSTNQVFTYTPQNLVETATVNGAVSTYEYDADDWRVVKRGQGSTTIYLRGVGRELLTEWQNPGASTQAIRDYVYAGSRMLAVVAR